MRLTVAVVGKPRNAALGAAIQQYESRAARYWPLDVHEVREERGGSLSPKIVRQREGERLARHIGSSRMVVCDISGKSYTSERFAEWLRSERDRDHDLTFLIGGASGLSEDLVERSSAKLALAPWTLAHELARLVLAEQLYRAGTIVRGEPYHK